jgi:methionine-rich copper-binding protein CopC
MAIVPLERGKGNAFEFSHKASTCPGNSGAPIVIGGKVVGFHARTEDGRNFGRAIAVLKDLESKGQESLPAKKKMFSDWESDFSVAGLDARAQRKLDAQVAEEFWFEFGTDKARVSRVDRTSSTDHDAGYDSAEEEFIGKVKSGKGRVSFGMEPVKSSSKGPVVDSRNESATMTDPAILSANVALAHQILAPSTEETSVAKVTEKSEPKETLASLATSVKSEPKPLKKVVTIIKTAQDLAAHDKAQADEEEATYTVVKSKNALKRERLEAKIRDQEQEKLANNSSFPPSSPKQADKEVLESCKTPVTPSGKKTEKSTASSKKLGHVSRSDRETPSEEVLVKLFDLLKQSGVSEKTFKRLLEAKGTKSEAS